MGAKKINNPAYCEKHFSEVVLPRYKALIYISVKRLRLSRFYEDLDELEQVGCLAIWEAYRDFDPSRNLKLRNFIIARIRFALLNNSGFSQGFSLSKRGAFTNALRQLKKQSEDGTPTKLILPRFASDPVKTFEKIHTQDNSINFDIKLLSDNLDPQNKHILDLHLAGFTNKEIGEQYSLSSQGIDMRLRKIKRSFKEKIDRDQNNTEKSKKNNILDIQDRLQEVRKIPKKTINESASKNYVLPKRLISSSVNITKSRLSQIDTFISFLRRNITAQTMYSHEQNNVLKLLLLNYNIRQIGDELEQTSKEITSIILDCMEIAGIR